MTNEIKDAAIEKMNKTIVTLKKDLAAIRAGRANPQILDRVLVDYYGVPTPINQLGNISCPEARVLTISVWDVKVISEVEKAIQKSDIGINPMSDGKIIRLVFPELTEERRKDLTKSVKKKGEEAKVAIRSIRRDANDHLKKLKKDNKITEDDLSNLEDEIQKTTDEHIKNIDKFIELKEKEIMDV